MRLDLDVLAPREARALLTRLLGAQRVRAEEDAAVAELARLCGHLPLALRIAAANLSGHPGATVAGYAAELAGSDRLRALEAGEDPETAVRMAFDRSYATLPATARRLFRLLGLVPGPDIGPRAAAALAATDAATAAALLDRLARAHLAGEHAPDCYGMHDLLRRHAADRAAEEDGQADRDAALGRLLDHYLHGVDAAARRLLPQMVRLPLAPPGNGQPVAGFDDEAQASEWLDAERRNLVACILHAAEHGPAAAWRLADALRGHLFLRASTVDWSLVANAGLAAAERAGDPAGQAAAHLSIATLHWVQNRTLEVGDRFMEGEAVRLRAVARREAGRPAEALHLARTAVALARDAGDRRNEADA